MYAKVLHVCYDLSFSPSSSSEPSSSLPKTQVHTQLLDDSLQVPSLTRFKRLSGSHASLLYQTLEVTIRYIVMHSLSVCVCGWGESWPLNSYGRPLPPFLVYGHGLSRMQLLFSEKLVCTLLRLTALTPH